MKIIKILNNNKIITVTGPPGTSKTFVACYAAIQAFLAGKCKTIVLSKPTEILSGTKDPGALPGSLDEKMAVYAESFFDAFDEILSRKDFKHLWDEKIIQFKPAQFLRGRTIKDSFIIIDEFQNFATDSFADIFSEARKYGLALIIAHQYINQVSTHLMDAIMGNIGNMAVFHIGSTDAKMLAPNIDTTLTPQTLVEQPLYNFTVKTTHNGQKKVTH